MFPSVVAIAAGVFGLVIGSFLNVVIYRVPNKRSIVSPPSACPHCGMQIKAYDNIPVVSWLLLRGRCRGCGHPISVRYPLVELATGVMFAAVSLWVGSEWGAVVAAAHAVDIVAVILVGVAFLFLAAVSIALALIDHDVHRLPDSIVLPGYLVGGVLLGVVSLLQGDIDAIIRAGIGLAALWLAYLLIAIAYPGGMGFGDVKLAGVLGLYLGWLGWGPLVVGAFSAFLLGGVFAIALLLARRASRKSAIAFGPWMLAGAWVGIFFGDSIAGGYLSLFGLM